MSTLVGGMCSICCHMTPLCIYIVFLTFSCFCPFFNFFFLFLKSGIETPDQNGQWYQQFQTLFAFFFMRALSKGLTIGLCLYVLLLYMCMFCIFNVCDLNLWKALRWPCAVDWPCAIYKPSINNNNNTGTIVPAYGERIKMLIFTTIIVEQGWKGRFLQAVSRQTFYSLSFQSHEQHDGDNARISGGSHTPGHTTATQWLTDAEHTLPSVPSWVCARASDRPWN